MPDHDLPTLLRVARARRRHTQARAAALVGVSRQTWCEWERGGAYPGVLTSADLADYLGVEVGELEQLRPEAT